MLIVSIVMSFAWLPMRGSAQGGDRDPVFEAMGFQPRRDYFGQLPFESIDALSGNLILSFTDLILPGNAGMDLRFVRTYNRNGSPAQWSFGPAGLPLTVRWPDGPVFEAVPPHLPVFTTADGAEHRTLPRTPFPGHSLDTILLTESFWRWNRSTHVLQLPNGWELSFSSTQTVSPGLTMAYLEEVRDAFDNRITFEWDHSTPARRLSVVRQWFGDSHRLIELDYAGASPGLPRTMRYEGREWVYSSESAHMPEGPSWVFDASDGLRVTAPHGGTVHYRFGSHQFQRLQPPQDGHPEEWIEVFAQVVTSREVGGHALAPGTWTFSYANLGTHREETTVIYPDGRRLLFEHGPTAAFSWEGSETNYAAVRRTLHAADGHVQESVMFDYQSLPVGDDGYAPIGFASQLKKRIVTRGGRSFVTESFFSDHNFADYHRPHKIEETGDAGDRITNIEFEYGFTRWIKDRVKARMVSSPGGGSFATSAGFNPSTGFMESETQHGITMTYGPTAEGNVATATDGHQHTTFFTYAWGVVENTSTPSFTISRTVNQDGTVASETRRGFTTGFEYDALGRIRWIKPPEGHWIETLYDNGSGRWIERRRVANGHGPRTTYSLDGFGRVVSTENSVGVRTRLEFDVYGRTTYESQPFYGADEHGTQLFYDALDRPTEVRHTSDGTLVTYGYPSGLDVHITEYTAANSSRTTVQKWAAFGDPSDARLASVTDGDGQTFGYDYDTIGNLTRVSQPGGVTRTWTYHGGTALLAAEEHPESGRTTYTYDSGRLESRTDANGRNFTYGYDANDRLTSVTPSGDQPPVLMDYDASDNRTFLSNGFVTSTFDFNAANQLTYRRDRIGSPNAPSVDVDVRYGFDAWGNLVEITYPSGRSVTYGYDSEGRPTQVTMDQSQSIAHDVHYHPSGAIRSFTLANGQTEWIELDSRQRPRYWKSGPFVVLDHAYDRVGNVQHVEDARTDRRSWFGYDALDRLTTVTGFGARTFTYDALGNRGTKSAAGGHNAYHVDPGSQRLTSITGPLEAGTLHYDHVGNLVSEPAGADAFTYTYTPFNMLATARLGDAVSLYDYDGDNVRKYRATPAGTYHYIHGPGLQLLSEFDATEGHPELLREYVYLGSRLLISVGRGVVPEPVLTVRLTSPRTGEAYPNDEVVELSAEAATTNPGDSIERVEFYRDGIPIGMATTAPYVLPWISNLPAGTYTLLARAVTTAGTAAVSPPVSVRFFLVGRVTGVAVSPSPVAAGQVATITVTGNANLCGAVGLDYGDGTAHVDPYDQALAVQPFVRTHVWTTGGTKTVTATGHGSCRDSVTTTVLVTGPEVSITTPGPGATFVAPATIAIEAAAVDTGSDTIARVEFYEGATLLGTATAPPFQIAWGGVAPGQYTLTAHAFNTAGIMAVSAPVSVEVSSLAVLTITPSVVGVGDPATLTVSGTSPCGALTFVFGDGDWVTDAIAGLPYSRTYAWSQGGTKTVVVTPEGGGCFGRVEATVEVVANALPHVALTSPAHGAGFAEPATIELAATASDSDGTVDRVEFYAGTTLLGTVTTAPYALAWNGVTAGTYSLTAQAVDNLGGRSTSSPAVVVVGVAVTGVSVAPASIMVGQSATVTVSGSPSCGAVLIDFGDGWSEAFPLSTLPWAVTRPWSVAGTQTITATGQGNCSGSASTTVEVTANPPPVVTLTAPASGTAFTTPATIALTATATDADGIDRVEFFAGTTLLGTATTAPYAYTWANTPLGTHALRAEAVDTYGARGVSATATVTVEHRITDVSVSPGSIVTGQPATVTVSGSPACGAVLNDFGDGTSEAYALWTLPFSVSRTWGTAGTKTITASGQGNCSGSATTTVQVATNPPPSVSVTAPASGSVYTSGTVITLAANASDSHGVAAVEFYVDGALVATDTTAPYQHAWAVPSGTRTLTARAIDVYGAAATSAGVTVTGRDVVSVSVSPAAPHAGDAALVSVFGSVSCGAVEINYGDGTVITYAISGLPISQYHTWASGGPKTVTATGHSTCLGTASTTVAVNAKPTVTLTSPAAGNTYAAPASVSLSATASDPDGWVQHVRFYANGSLLATVAAAPYNYTWTNVPAGSYTIAAVATDNAGATTTASAGISVVDPGPSQVTSVVAPATAAVGQAVTVTTYGTNPCGALYLGWGDGNGWYHAIWELPYSYTYTWSAPGTYTITAQGQGNCSGQASTVITVTGEELDAEEPAGEPEEVGWWPLEGEGEEDGAALDPWAPDAVSRGRVVLTGRAVGTSGWTAAPAATAAPQTMATLVVQLAGTGSGRVHLSGAADCVAPSGGSCSPAFASGTAVTLTATADAGSSFAGWGGACGGTAACTLTLAEATLVVATFQVPPPLVTQYYHVDMLGSVRAVTDDTGAVLRRYDYAAFGEEFVEELGGTVPADGKQPRFVGKERDAETYLDYFGARYYRARWGRFTTVDPVMNVEAALADPQRWNRYAHVRNNPLRFVDPDGRELRLLIYNSSQLTREQVSRIASNIADKFSQAGVKDVTYEIKDGRPSRLMTMRYQLLPTRHSHLLEIRQGREGVPSIRRRQAGHNWWGHSAVNTSEIQKHWEAGVELETGVTNVGTHEIAHDVLGHASGPANLMREDGASDSRWLANLNLRFTEEQAEALRRRYNRPEPR